MRDCDKGIQRIDIPLSEYVLDRLLSADSEDEMFRILSFQHTGLPRFDSRDVLKIDFDNAGKELQREGYVALAVLQVARGHRLLAEFITGHVLSKGHSTALVRTSGSDDVAVVCNGCGRELMLRSESLRPLHMDPHEPHHLDVLTDLKEETDTHG